MNALDALGGLGLLALLLGTGEGGGGGGGLAPSVGPLAPPAPSPTTPVAPLWPSALPPTLPPFPGDAWEPDTPVSTPVVQRAVALLPVLWAQGEGSHTVEMTAGHWVAYLAQVLNGKHGVTAWRLKVSTSPAAPSLDNVRPGMPGLRVQPENAVPVAPRVVVVPSPQGPAIVTPAAPTIVTPPSLFVPASTTPPLNVAPPPIGKYPGPGAWKSNATYVRRYQRVLAYLAQHTGNTSWDPQGVDGIAGKNTMAAVRAFQTYNGLTPVDGEAGAATAAALDHWLQMQAA